ncbi:DF family (seleno)protein [Rubrobacter aplysinae]|uniref:DF family (seleno)protein n=1 Tax=Rubrobacter aplysinae TaxID=909625 RepID=UPI00128B454A|nr:thioredoxin family protein [Rubrobacter aplysinae]
MQAMRVELLYFEGCPSAGAAEHNLREALGLEGVRAEVVPVRVETDDAAERLRFPGSPTVRLGGEDAFPVSEERERWALGCRTYVTPEGLRGSPTVGMFRSAIRAAAGE